MSDEAGKTVGSERGTMGRMFIAVLALIAAIVVSVILVFRYIDEERERGLLDWQARLGIVASSRAAAVDSWVARQFEELQALAGNPSLAIYLMQLRLNADGTGPAPDGAEAGYLRNLLSVTADRAGFAVPPTGPDVRANVTRIGVGGLILMDMKGRFLVGTPNPPPVEGPLRAFIESQAGDWTTPDGRALLDIHRGPAGQLVMGFAVPIFDVQGDPIRANQIGVVLGIRPIDDAVIPLLEQPGATERTAEVLLLRRSDQVIEYLSPLADGAAALSRKMAINTPELAAAFAIQQPEGFAIRRDYRGRDVLVVSRKLTNAPWLIAHKIDRAEALDPGETRLRRLLSILLLAIGMTAIAIVAVWYKGASRRASAAARRFEEMAQRLEQQRNFLRVLTNSQPNANAIIDVSGHYRFANEAAGRHAGMEQEDMVGKNLANVLGTERAKQYERLNRDALDSSETVTAVHRFENGKGLQVIQSLHVPMTETDDMPRGILMVEEDITGAVTERERRERILRQLVGKLVAIVDRRDPHAADHSARVARVARAVAEEMGLDPIQIETAEFAGNLMNIGKIFVPVELLTKTGSLSDAEIKQVRGSIQLGADFVDGIEFDGPVAETLRQSQERWDGSGEPKGLAGEAITVTARAVAVANAFVAMTSARAHRPGLSFDDAVERLLGDVGKAFDRRAVTGLVSRLDNHGGRQDWADLLTPAAAEGNGGPNATPST